MQLIIPLSKGVGQINDLHALQEFFRPIPVKEPRRFREALQMEPLSRLVVLQIKDAQTIFRVKQEQIPVFGRIVPHMAVLLTEGLAKAVVDVVEQVDEIVDRCGLARAVHTCNDIDVINVRLRCAIGPEVLGERCFSGVLSKRVVQFVITKDICRREIELNAVQSPQRFWFSLAIIKLCIAIQ